MTCPVCGSEGHIGHRSLPRASLGHDTGFILTTPDQIQAWRLLAFSHMLELEMKGMHHSRGLRASVWIRAILKDAKRPAPRLLSDLHQEYEKYLTDCGYIKPLTTEL